ncbi:hypothetical protein FAZ78_25855 [Cereibacter changlensis]|uniref:Uncharacterized protein n=1 Tax=Cereibacter changlensis TaxID=402884 RepID=A0A4U0YQD1_9RHOB|nr:hypothetical protein [Cereibacter changlensis]TKA93815.1 hypothetical protein FAZ78_25855 [Cereibacter changlensis]
MTILHDLHREGSDDNHQAESPDINGENHRLPCTNLGLTITGVERRTTLRPCLQGQPKIAGMIGPCYGGEDDGVPVIRYEDAATHAALGA